MPKNPDTPRLQLNIRMDNEAELHYAIKERAEKLNTTVTDITIAALKHSFGWQMPADAIAMLNKINANESEIEKLKKELQELKEKLS